MSTQQNTNLAAIIKTSKDRITVENRPIPTPGSDEILVRNKAIAANPVDWKIQAYDVFVTTYPNVLGSDVSGFVEAVGSGVTKFKVGDRVTGFSAVIYNQNIDHGAWQTYTLLREVATTKIPEALSFEEASTFPMAFATAAVGLYINLGLPRTNGKAADRKEAFLVWGGASSVGAAAIQLANNLGYKVFTTASPRHHDYLRSIGAHATFDYRDPDVVSKVIDAAKSSNLPLNLGFDAVTENDTSKLAADILSSTSAGAGKLVLTLGWPEAHAKPENVEILNTAAYRLGVDAQDVGAWFFNEFLRDALEEKLLVAAPPVEIVEGGVAAAQKVFDRYKEGGVSGQKLVVKVE